MQTRFKVFVADPIHAGGMGLLAEHFEVVHLPVDAPLEERNAAAAEADAIVVRLFRITPELLARARNLKAVIKHGIGVDNIDIDACTAHGVLVANTPGGSNAHCVAEGAVTLILAVYRKVLERHGAVVQGRFLEARQFPVTESLWGKTVGILGLGQIGRFTAQICKGFNCTILGYDPLAPGAAFEQAGVERVAGLGEVLSRSDIVSVHVPLTKETRHLIGAPELARMKTSAVIVNTARGGIIDEDALAQALRDGRIAGAGIDVFEEEPPSLSSPLLSAPNIVLSPHVAGMSQDSLRELGEAVAAATSQALGGTMPATTLNRAAWEKRGL
ncbi:MAG TPA: NAD(P)-dependent oxidoreductase [Rhizobiaceae bacterium]|nr:NAD(P)-dependent oxidoreductase [Rhizobiaceae bacterium]